MTGMKPPSASAANENESKLCQLNMLKEMYNVIDDSYFIPCLLIRGMSPKVMIHFHANGEDISHTQRLLTRLSIEFKLNIICVEYPGYGIYKNSSENKSAVNEKKA